MADAGLGGLVRAWLFIGAASAVACGEGFRLRLHLHLLFLIPFPILYVQHVIEWSGLHGIELQHLW